MLRNHRAKAGEVHGTANMGSATTRNKGATPQYPSPVASPGVPVKLSTTRPWVGPSVTERQYRTRQED
jgi:hypothetical protein